MSAFMDWMFSVSAGQPYKTSEERENESSLFFSMNTVSILIIIIVLLLMLAFFLFRTFRNQLILGEHEIGLRPTFEQTKEFTYQTLRLHNLIPPLQPQSAV